MGHVRIDDAAPHHRKQLEAGPAACWLWVCGLAYCQRTKSDGLIPLVAMPLLGVWNWKKLAGFLVTARLWHKEDNGYRVHDYLHWNGSREERDQQAEENRARIREWRKKKKPEPTPQADVTLLHPSVTPSVTQQCNEQNGEQNSVTHPLCSSLLSSSPTPTRTSTPPRPLVAKRNLNAAFEHPRFDVPQTWHNRSADGLSDGERGLSEFYTWLSAQVDASNEDTLPRFKWLDARFAQWLQLRTGSVSDVPSVEETRRRYLGTR